MIGLRNSSIVADAESFEARDSHALSSRAPDQRRGVVGSEEQKAAALQGPRCELMFQLLSIH